MDEKNFLDVFKKLLLIEREIYMTDRLAEMAEWDSFSYVAFTAMAEDDFNVMLDAGEVRRQITVGDLYALLSKGGE